MSFSGSEKTRDNRGAKHCSSTKPSGKQSPIASETCMSLFSETQSPQSKEERERDRRELLAQILMELKSHKERECEILDSIDNVIKNWIS